MNQAKPKIILFLILFIPLFALAQQPLSLKSAIDTALKSSFEIQIATNNAEISKMNNKTGVAGGLPSVSVTAGDNESLSNISQKLSDGSEINKSNVAGNNLNTGISASMTLFNGFKITAVKERLGYLQKQSEILLNQQIQNTIAAIMVKYYDILRQEGYLKIIRSSLEVSNKKLEIVTERKNVGMANDADFLQAQIDRNLAEQNLKAQQSVIEQGKTDLLSLMCVKQYFPFVLTDSISIDRNIQLDSITAYLIQNPKYLSAGQQIKINEQIVKEMAAQRYPSVKINTGYNFTRNQSDAGLTLMNQNYGPTVGLTLQIPIYNGNAYKIQKNAATFNVNNAKLEQESLLSSLTANAVKTYESYKTTLEQINSQQANLDLANKLVSVVMLRFQVNQATILDVKTAQASYESVGYQLINLQYAAKIAEIELKRLTYSLGY